MESVMNGTLEIVDTKMIYSSVYVDKNVLAGYEISIYSHTSA
jgi:hypothetical protein